MILSQNRTSLHPLPNFSLMIFIDLSHYLPNCYSKLSIVIFQAAFTLDSQKYAGYSKIKNLGQKLCRKST